MKYVGSKGRLAKYLLEVMLPYRKKDQTWYEPFVGGGNMIEHVEGNRKGSDVNECLISCLDALSKRWTPPKNITREFYSECRTKYNSKTYTEAEMPMIGYVGINGSYGGRYYDGGYAGITTTKQGKTRNYPEEAFNNVVKQQPNLIGVEFNHCSYLDAIIPTQSVIYCDPPYNNTKEYIEAKKSGFDSEVFWQWCRERVEEGHTVFVSEYTAPQDFKCIWEKQVSSSLRANSEVSGSKKSVERLFKMES